MENKVKLQYTVWMPKGYRLVGNGTGTIVREKKKVYKSDPCPCGSDKRAKHCHPQLVNKGKPLKARSLKLEASS